MANDIEEEEGGDDDGGAPGWLTTWADMMSVLLTFFIVFAMRFIQPVVSLLTFLKGSLMTGGGLAVANFGGLFNSHAAATTPHGGDEASQRQPMHDLHQVIFRDPVRARNRLDGHQPVLRRRTEIHENPQGIIGVDGETHDGLLDLQKMYFKY